MSSLVKDTLAEADDEEDENEKTESEPIPLNNVASNVLEKVIAFCQLLPLAGLQHQFLAHPPAHDGAARGSLSFLFIENAWRPSLLDYSDIIKGKYYCWVWRGRSSSLETSWEKKFLFSELPKNSLAFANQCTGPKLVDPDNLLVTRSDIINARDHKFQASVHGHDYLKKVGIEKLKPQKYKVTSPYSVNPVKLVEARTKRKKRNPDELVQAKRKKRRSNKRRHPLLNMDKDTFEHDDLDVTAVYVEMPESLKGKDNKHQLIVKDKCYCFKFSCSKWKQLRGELVDAPMSLEEFDERIKSIPHEVASFHTIDLSKHQRVCGSK